MKLIISKNRHNVYKDFLSIGYLGENNSRVINIQQPSVENADSYKLRFKYNDNIAYDLPIQDNKAIITNSVLREPGEVQCQWIATNSNAKSGNVVAKSDIFTLIIEESLPDGVAVPTPEASIEAMEKCHATLEQCKSEVTKSQKYSKQAKNSLSIFTESVEDINKSLYDFTLSQNLLQDKNVLENQSVNQSSSSDLNYETENYEFVNETITNRGSIISESIELQNNLYIIIANEAVTLDVLLYNPYKGIYEDEIHTYDSDWFYNSNNQYVYVFTLNTNYTKNYVRIFSTKNLSVWNTYDVKFYQLDKIQRLATKVDLQEQSDKVDKAQSDIITNSAQIKENRADIISNTTQIAKNTEAIKKCHYYFSSFNKPANIDTANHKITIQRLLVIPTTSTHYWIDNIELTYNTSWSEFVVYYNFDEPDRTKQIGVCSWNYLPKNTNVEIIMNVAPNHPQYAQAKFNFTIDGKKV